MFSGIKFGYLDDQMVGMNMRDYILEIVEEFGEDITIVMALPATRLLFSRDNTARQLKDTKLEDFIPVVETLLCIIQ